MDASCKLWPFVISKSRLPRCFKNPRDLLVRYAANKKAWMTDELFTNWLQEWNYKMKSGRQVCFLLNCLALHVASLLKNIRKVFLANTAVKLLQPFNQGIIKAFKVV